MTKDNTNGVTVSWERQSADSVPILGYVVQIIKKSMIGEDDELTLIHMNNKKNKGKCVLEDSEKNKDVLVRVCIRNSLCIYEYSCSKGIGLSPGKYKFLIIIIIIIIII